MAISMMDERIAPWSLDGPAPAVVPWLLPQGEGSKMGPNILLAAAELIVRALQQSTTLLMDGGRRRRRRRRRRRPRD
jgi:hypothetical protein